MGSSRFGSSREAAPTLSAPVGTVSEQPLDLPPTTDTPAGGLGNSLSPSDLNLLIPHQANLRISQFVAHTLKLREDQVYNNIQKYGNTTAASVPIALCEAWENGLVKPGDLICLAAFGSGFTWASALLRW
jgi:hypothetical protein